MEPSTVADHEAHSPTAGGHGRVASLDLLRGLCAVAVAAYHGLSWIGLGTFHNLGLYGVYLFFLLSGASMSLAYARRFRRGYPYTSYLALRYVRLAPLYGAVALYEILSWGLARYSPAAALGRWLLNVTFLFGFANPGGTAIATGGWSLGIEFVFYFVFPLFVAILASRAAPLLVALALGAQLVFVNVVLAGGTLLGNWAAYTQFASFIGYFACGTWLGLRFIDGKLVPARVQSLGWLAWLALLAAVGAGSGATDESCLTGARGALLTAACCALVAVTLMLEVPRPIRRVAAWLGEASYPMYLVHPLIYRQLNTSRALAPLHDHHSHAFIALFLIVTFVAGIVIYRVFEEPILRWGKRRIG